MVCRVTGKWAMDGVSCHCCVVYGWCVVSLVRGLWMVCRVTGEWAMDGVSCHWCVGYGWCVSSLVCGL